MKGRGLSSREVMCSDPSEPHGVVHTEGECPHQSGRVSSDYQPTDEAAMWVSGWPYRTHTLKTVQPYFRDVRRGDKTFEVRRDDRGFQPGDLLVLAEWYDVDGFTGQDCVREVTYVLRDGDAFGVQPGFVVLGLRKPTTTDRRIVTAPARTPSSG